MKRELDNIQKFGELKNMWKLKNAILKSNGQRRNHEGN